LALHADEGQLIPRGLLVTVPEPVPETCTRMATGLMSQNPKFESVADPAFAHVNVRSYGAPDPVHAFLA
jgi:hypothetical protein